MAKSVTVLGLEGDTLRGVRLDAVGDGFVRGHAESWPLSIPIDSGDETEVGDEKKTDEGDVSATEEVVEEDKPLARAFRAAAAAFDTNEFVLALPLSSMLVKTVCLPVEARDDLTGAALLQLDGISPFPNEVLTPGVEIMSENDKEMVSVIAALPDAASVDVSEALAAAKVHVLRTDVTVLAWLRGVWPQICAKQDFVRRLVLFNLDGGWDMVVVENEIPTFVRGLGVVDGEAELCREIMLSLLSRETPIEETVDVVVCSLMECENAILERLAEFGTVRTIIVEDEFAGVDGAAGRTIEGGAIDVTPVAWTEAREENRFRRKLMVGLSIAGGIWLAMLAVLFGVDTCYGFMSDYKKSQQKEKKHATAFREVSAMTNRVVLIERYADHAHGALEVLKAVSDSLPQSDEMAFRTFQYRRDESVRVNGSAGEREELRTFTENLENVTFQDEEDALFAKVQQTGGETQTKKGIRFAIECFFHGDEEKGGK